LHGQNQILVECSATNGEGQQPVSKSHVIRVLCKIFILYNINAIYSTFIIFEKTFIASI
jgi:hypothetical protein